MFHKVTILGNLGTDPETRYTQNGANVCSFNVATNREYTMANGERVKETVWWRVSAWGRLGEVCQQYLAKGRPVFIEGEIQPDRETGNPRIWTDQNNQPRASYELRASTVQFLGSRDGDFGDTGYQQQDQRPASSGGRRSTMSAPPGDEPDDEFSPDEIPF